MNLRDRKAIIKNKEVQNTLLPTQKTRVSKKATKKTQITKKIKETKKNKSSAPKQAKKGKGKAKVTKKVKMLIADEEEMEQEYGLTTMILEYEATEMEKTDISELVKLLSHTDINRRMLGVYSLYKRLLEEKDSKVRDIVAQDPVILEATIGVLKEKEEIRVIVVKFLTALLSNNSIVLAPKIDSLFFDEILNATKDEDTTIVCYALNLVDKVLTICSAVGQTKSKKEIKQTITTILEIDPTERENPEHILAVKFKAFNSLLSLVDKKEWKEYAWSWIEFTSNIITVGSLSSYRNIVFESWLSEEIKLQKEFLQNKGKKALLLEKGLEGGTVFFLLHVFKHLKKEIVALGLREQLQKEVLDVPESAL